jgi:hypothetical protein
MGRRRGTKMDYLAVGLSEAYEYPKELLGKNRWFEYKFVSNSIRGIHYSPDRVIGFGFKLYCCAGYPCASTRQ